MIKKIHVHIGEVKVAKKGEILTTILGSCVGIGIIWRSKKICGLAHCLLPNSPVPSFAMSGRFVDKAIPSLLALMKITNDNIVDIEAVLAGGGSMTAPNEASGLIGSSNLQVAIKELGKRSIRVIRTEVGGIGGCKFFLNASDFSFYIEKIPRLERRVYGE